MRFCRSARRCSHWTVARNSVEKRISSAATAAMVGLSVSRTPLHIWRGKVRCSDPAINAERDNRVRERHGVKLDRLDAKTIRDLEPNLAPLYHRGVLFRDAYTIDSPKALAFALAEAILKRGGTFVRGEARGLMATQAGASVRIDGNEHDADHIVIACGAWSRELAHRIGDRVLLDTERGYHILFPSAGKLLHRPVCHTEYGFYMTPMADGMRAAGTVELGGLAAPFNPVRTRVIRSAVAMLLPGAGEGSSEWLGFHPSMPDSLPVIGAAPSSPRMTYAFGHGHLGLTLASVSGRLVAELVCSRPTTIAVGGLRPDRFNRMGWPRAASQG